MPAPDFESLHADARHSRDEELLLPSSDLITDLGAK